MLRKVIKHEFLNTWLQYAVLFGAAIFLPALVYLATQNVIERDQNTFRILVAVLGGSAVIIVTLAWTTLGFEKDFTTKNAYLYHTLPVKMSTFMISKTLFFIIWSALSILFTLLCACFSVMDFSVFPRIFDYIAHNLQETDTVGEFVMGGVWVLRIILAFITLYGLNMAGYAFGHLFGKHNRLGEFIFIISIIILYLFYSYILQGFTNTLGLRSNAIVFYVDFAVGVIVTIAFCIFAHHVFTKKLNIL
ncbi:MAG: hypothetical protein LBL98_02870 [Ruminococcus sp.]|jgi:hypothetical protein|nr:hypothetical protein [Ruminococcus sp.]